MKLSRYLSLLTACCCCLILAWPKACPNDPFENPNDPAAENDAYIPKPNGLLIEDFDDGKIPNLLGYCHEIFLDDLGPFAIIDTSYISDRKDVLRGGGKSWRIHFNVSKEPPLGKDTYCGYVELLTGNDLCKRPNAGLFNLAVLNLTFLTFWVKTESPDIDFEMALKDIKNNETNPKKRVKDNYLTPGILWRKVKIPITDLLPNQSGPPVNLQELREINFSFSYRYSQQPRAPLTGTIYLDEIAFER